MCDIRFLLLLCLSYTTIAGTKFPSHLDYNSKKFNLIGETLLEYSFLKIDVYYIAYYRSEDKKNAILYLRYARDIGKEVSRKGWEKSLKLVLGDRFFVVKDKLQWFYSVTPSMKENDELQILKLAGRKTVFLKNGKEIGTSEDSLIFKLAHAPWLSEKPIDKNLKNALLGEE